MLKQFGDLEHSGLNLTYFIQIPLLSHSKGDSLNNALRISLTLVLRQWTLDRLL